MNYNDRILSSEIALEKANQNDIILIDVRRPDEWNSTGIPQKSYPICMSDEDFLGKVAQITGYNQDTPIAIICAAGGRSARVVNALCEQGYNFVYDVSEGMMGGANGAGWINKGLPVTPYQS